MSMLGGGISQVEARIGEIESRIRALSGANDTAKPSTQTPPPAASSPSSFAQALTRATGGASPVSGLPLQSPAGDFKSLPPPPGWVTPMPVQPSTAPASAGIAQWENLIQSAASEHNVPADLVRAVMTQESQGNPRAVSSAGAQGLMQLMPATARALGVADPFDPEQNVRGGVSLLRQNLDKYDGDTRLALAAYNAGPGNVAKYGGVPPFKETQNYVAKIMSRLGDTP
jgi:soluble lytic murein transglycosylase-like protein